MHNSMIIKGLFPLKSLGTYITHIWTLSSVFPLMHLGLVLVGEHHVAEATLDGLDLPMRGVDVAFQMIRFHK